MKKTSSKTSPRIVAPASLALVVGGESKTKSSDKQQQAVLDFIKG